MKPTSHWIACRPLAEINQPAWIEDIQKDAANHPVLTADDILTLSIRHDELKIVPASNLSRESFRLREVISKILRQCEGRE